MKTLTSGLLTLLVVTTLVACGGGTSAGSEDASVQAKNASGLSDDQMKNGIGPIEAVSLDATLDETLDEALIARGSEIFNLKCMACHRLDKRYVGPPLGTVLDRRTPAYAMNMMLNTEEMLAKHPTAKGLLAEFMTPMPNQNLTEQDARAVLEFLRQAHAELSADSTDL